MRFACAHGGRSGAENRDRAIAHGFRRAGDAARNLAAIGDQYFLERPKNHYGFAAVFATKPYGGQAAAPANSKQLAAARGLLRLRRRLHGKQQVRRLAPVVADREAQRPLALLLEEFDKLRLLRMGELPDGG